MPPRLPHHLLLLSTVFTSLLHTARSGCSFPDQMSGAAATTDGKSYKFSMDLISQRAVFRDYRNPSVFKYFDYSSHRRYQRFPAGGCLITKLNKGLRLPTGVSDVLDKEIVYQYPSPPHLPRQVHYRRPTGQEFSVFLHTNNTTSKCMPEDWPYFLEAPDTPVATTFVFSANSTEYPYDIDEDLSQCVFGSDMTDI